MVATVASRGTARSRAVIAAISARIVDLTAVQIVGQTVDLIAVASREAAGAGAATIAVHAVKVAEAKTVAAVKVVAVSAARSAGPSAIGIDPGR